MASLTLFSISIPSTWPEATEKTQRGKVTWWRSRTEIGGQGLGCWPTFLTVCSLWGLAGLPCLWPWPYLALHRLSQTLPQLAPAMLSRGFEGSPFFSPMKHVLRFTSPNFSSSFWGVKCWARWRGSSWVNLCCFMTWTWHGGGWNPEWSIWESSHSLGHSHQPIMSLGVAFETPRKYPFGELVPHTTTIVWA